MEGKFVPLDPAPKCGMIMGLPCYVSLVDRYGSSLPILGIYGMFSRILLHPSLYLANNSPLVECVDTTSFSRVFSAFPIVYFL